MKTKKVKIHLLTHRITIQYSKTVKYMKANRIRHTQDIL